MDFLNSTCAISPCCAHCRGRRLGRRRVAPAMLRRAVGRPVCERLIFGHICLLRPMTTEIRINVGVRWYSDARRPLLYLGVPRTDDPRLLDWRVLGQLWPVAKREVLARLMRLHRASRARS